MAGGGQRQSNSPSFHLYVASEVRCTSPQVQMDEASTLRRVQRPQEVSAAQRIFLLGCSGRGCPGEGSGGHSGKCAAAICQGVLKYFNTCTPGLATPGCAGSKSALPLSAFGRGRNGRGFLRQGKPNQRGFWQFTWPPRYLRVNSRFMGHLPPAESLPTKAAMH